MVWADADAVSNGAALAEHVIQRGIAGIDDDGARRLAGIKGYCGAAQPLGQAPAFIRHEIVCRE